MATTTQPQPDLLLIAKDHKEFKAYCQADQNQELIKRLFGSDLKTIYSRALDTVKSELAQHPANQEVRLPIAKLYEIAEIIIFLVCARYVDLAKHGAAQVLLSIEAFPALAMERFDDGAYKVADYIRK